jgi:hypothetical protein
MGNKHLEQSSFKAEMTQEMLQEQLYILHDVGTSSFVVSSTLYSALKEDGLEDGVVALAQRLRRVHLCERLAHAVELGEAQLGVLGLLRDGPFDSRDGGRQRRLVCGVDGEQRAARGAAARDVDARSTCPTRWPMLAAKAPPDPPTGSARGLWARPGP